MVQLAGSLTDSQAADPDVVAPFLRGQLQRTSSSLATRSAQQSLLLTSGLSLALPLSVTPNGEVPEGVVLPPPEQGSAAAELQRLSVDVTARVLQDVPPSNAAIQLVGRSMQGAASVGVASEELAESVVDNVQVIIEAQEREFTRV